MPILQTRYLHGLRVDEVLAQENENGNTIWHLSDHVGTVRDLLDSSGTLVNHFTYDSFGNVTSQTNSAIDTRYLFTGREFDREIGLYNYRARYYDAAIGRFLGEDPIGLENKDLNLYAYVANRPVDTIDPLGLFGLVTTQNRTIRYDDNGTKTTNNIEDVIVDRAANPNLSILSDVTQASIEYSPTNTGSPVDQRISVPDVRPTDDKGHIVGSQLGGDGRVRNNLFAQNSTVNRGRRRSNETRVRNYLDNNRPVTLDYTTDLVYPVRSLRPNWIDDRADFSDGNVILASFTNP